MDVTVEASGGNDVSADKEDHDSSDDPDAATPDQSESVSIDDYFSTTNNPAKAKFRVSDVTAMY